MIQNFFVDSLVKNYTAPSYPIFIALENFLNSVNSKKSMRDTKSDISALVLRIGPEAQKFVLLRLFECLQLPECKQKPNSSHKLQLLVELLKEYSTTTSFLSYFPEILVKLSKDHKISTLLNKMIVNLKISMSIQVVIALSLYLSDRSEFSVVGEEYLIKKLGDLKNSGKGAEVPEKIVQELLFQISRNPEINQKLEEQYNYLLQICENANRLNQIKIYNYFKGDWQFFANQLPIIQKPLTFSVKKVDYLRDLGPSATHQIDTLKTVLVEAGSLNEEDVFQCLMMMAEQKGKYETGVDKFVNDVIYASKKNYKSDELVKIFTHQISPKKNYSNWNIENFLTFCTQNVQNIKWQNVIGNFDRTKLVFLSQQHFHNMMKIFEKVKRLGQKWKIPEALYFKKWVHPASQAAFLTQVFKCKQLQCLQLHQVPNKRIQKSAKDEALLKQIWGYTDMVQLLFEVSQFNFMEIRQLLQYPMSKYPELLLQTLSEIKPSKGQALLDEVFSQILPNYLHNHSSNIKLLQSLWQANQDLVISCICEIYKAQSKKDNSFNLSRVLDITQSIKDSLLPFTTWSDYEFSIPLAVIAGKRQFLNFEPWLQDRIEKLGNSFVKAILLYVDNYLVKPLKTITVQAHKENILEKAQLNVELLNKIFYTIMVKIKRQDMTPRNFQYLKRVFKECCIYFPQISDGSIPDQMEKQTEREMNRIYKEDITVKQAIQRMKKLKNSKKPEDQEQLASHITFLCSELTYHHSYPERQLNITAELFTNIINANLIEKKVYQMFLHVLEDNMKEDNQKYIFAIKVMQKIKGKLAIQSWLCEHLIDCEIIMKKNPEFVEELIDNLDPPKKLSIEKQKKLKQAIKNKNNPPIIPTTIITILPSSNLEDQQQINEFPIEASSPTTPNSSLKKVELNDYDIMVTLDQTKRINFPQKEVKLGKINITCNNLTLNNVEQKAKQLEKILDNPDVVKLLAHNIMFKRVSISQNNGAQILYRLVERLPKVQKSVMTLTYKILKKWFGLTGKSVNDNKINNFKNIGAWLGKLTIGRGQPVPIYLLNLKNILINSFTTGNRLSMNVAVILKILQYINLHPDVFRSASPWLSRVIGTLNEIEDKLKDDQNTKSLIKAFFKSISIKVDLIPIPPTSYLNSNNRIIISELDRYITVDEQLEKYYSKLNIDLKMIITRAVDDSIQEIVEPVIDRAVKIAKVTTKQLILKDFASQSNPDKFRESSYNVVKNMAGPLAHVTCRQPLKASMNRSLKALLSQSISDPNQIDNIIQKAIPDNLDFGCTLIKQAVIESAQDSIKKDAAINEAIQMRITALKNNQQFKDQVYLREIPSIVPEQLRPKSGGLTVQEYFVYNEFKNERRQPTGNDKSQDGYNLEKVLEIIAEKGSAKKIRQILLVDLSFRDELMAKVYTTMSKQPIQQAEMNYYIDICQVLGDFVEPKEAWKIFKQVVDIKKKQSHPIIKRLIREKCFLETIMSQIDESNEQYNKVIILFEKWLDTAHQKIEPFLRTLEEIFNKSENQIKIFFSSSLMYAMQKVQQSMSVKNQSYDTNYIEDYSKLIIISYKTIASNNCSLYLEHTIQAILQVFDKLQNSETSQGCSYQRPFFKLFTNLIGDITRKQYDIDNEKVLTFYCVLAKQFNKIGPLQYPGFSFAWVQLISNKNLVPALLNHHEYWDLYYNLLSCLFKFLKEYISEECLYHKENGEIYQSFYKGVLKLMVVIIHDFSDFLSEFSLQMCLLPGPRFIQLTNMIISAYPRDMKFQFPLKIETKAELVVQAKKGGEPKYYKIKFDKKKYDEILKADPKDTSLKQKLAAEDDQNLQTFVLYAGWSAENGLTIEESSKRFGDILIQSTDALKQRLVTYMVNLIRYPNSVTLLFINLAQEIIFKASNDTSTRDTLLINILSRMNAEGPQAWGLDYLVKQLMMQKNSLVHLHVPNQILKLL